MLYWLADELEKANISTISWVEPQRYNGDFSLIDRGAYCVSPISSLTSPLSLNRLLLAFQK